MMNRTVHLIAVTITLAVTGAGAAAAKSHTSTKKKGWGQAMVTCPVMHQKVPKSKAIAVKNRSGKTVWVCCKGCIASAKKLR